MTAFNAVRFRAKSGRDQEFLDAHRNAPRDWPGLKHVNMIKTGDKPEGAPQVPGVGRLTAPSAPWH